MGNIKTAHRERTRFVHSSKKDTHELLTAYRGLLKDMAENVKDFLVKGESFRKGDFKAMMEGVYSEIRKIQARSKEVRGDARGYIAQVQKELKDMAQDLKKFFADSEDTRKANFTAMMKEIAKRVESVRGETKEMMRDYNTEHKEATGHWASLPERETPSEKAEEAAEAAEQEGAAETRAPARRKKTKKE